MSVDEFFEGYAADFTTYHAPTFAERFVYPVHSVSETDADPRVITAGRSEWLVQLDRLLGAYRELRVTTARLHSTQVTQLGRGLHVAYVDWTLLRADNSPVYNFKASHTLITPYDTQRISAIAHNEEPKLRAALADRRGKPRGDAGPAPSHG